MSSVLNAKCLANDLSETPFQDLEIKLNGRTTTHRFFKKTDGSSVDDLTTLISSEDQEGDSFFYQDNKGKTEPEMTSYSMNAILGSSKCCSRRCHTSKSHNS